VESLYRIENLTKKYPLETKGLFRSQQRYINAVDNVSFKIYKGETFGIVGESGSGKTTLARMLLRLIEPTQGNMLFDGCEITSLNRVEMKKARRRMQMIFQDPYSCLDPRKTILDIISEPLKVHGLGNEHEIIKKVKEALEQVDLSTSEQFIKKIPEELSGGQRQRVGIARALVIQPEFIVADEPVSMLDASVKADIVSLMMDLKEKNNLTYVFITHEIALAYHICDRIAVMYLGEMVEKGSVKDVIQSPAHPYTKLLIEAVPPLIPDEKWSQKDFGAMTFSSNGQGCKFFNRCNQAQPICQDERPSWQELENEHLSSCHFVNQ
jgi:oligopeptide transport system ATP-binding protein